MACPLAARPCASRSSGHQQAKSKSHNWKFTPLPRLPFPPSLSVPSTKFSESEALWLNRDCSCVVGQRLSRFSVNLKSLVCCPISAQCP